MDVTEIANFGIEMPQLYLCLCKNCSSRYKQFRDGNKEKFKEEMTKALRNIDIETQAEDYEIELSSDATIHFTQTHLAEVKEILSLLEQYGIPGQEGPEPVAETVSQIRETITGPLAHPQLERKQVYIVDHRRDDQRRDRSVEQPQSERKPTAPQPLRHEEKSSINNVKKAVSQPAPYIGARVQHKAFGDGIIVNIDDPYIGVSFQKVGEKKFRIPDAFNNGFLSML